MASETEVTYWAAELAKSGEVRVRPRREVTALTALIYGVVLTNEIHHRGLALITVTSFELAEHYVEQVRSLARPRGFPLTATMEPE